MYLNRNLFIGIVSLLLTGCSSGFLGLAPMGDRKEYIQARESYEQGDYQAAISQLSDYIYKTKNVSRREARAYRLLAKSYEQLDQPSRALETYLEALEFHPKNVPLLTELGRLYQQNGLTERSIEMYDRALAAEPDNRMALTGQAANYTTLGFYSKARSFYDRLFELSEDISPQYLALYAATFLRQREYERAFIHITQALMQDDSNPDFWRLSAEAHRGLHMPQEALKDLEIAILLAPDRMDLLSYKALWLYETGKYNLSLQTVEKIMQHQPDSTLAQFIEALNLYKQGSLKTAQKKLEQLTKTAPNSFISEIAKKWLDYRFHSSTYSK